MTTAGEPIEKRGGDNRIAEDLSPFGEAAVQVRIMAPFRIGR